MKNYKEMADAVFRRRDEYAVALKRKKKIALSASLSLCSVCLAVLGAFGIWKSGVLTPDPHVIGTKPPYMTEATDSTKQILGSNATSEGIYSENTQIISGNSRPTATQNTTPDSTEVTKPEKNTSATDPVEKPAKPVVKPTLPTLPVGPQLPPTSPDTQRPVIIPTMPIITEPVETPDVTAATDGNPGNDCDTPQSNGPGKPWPPTAAPTDAPEAEAPGDDFAVPDETQGVPVTTAPCCTDPTEPCTESPMASLPCDEPTEPNVGAPETQAPSASFSYYGKVIDQNGHPVKGAKVTLYYSSSNYTTVTTDSSGGFSFTDITYRSGLYVKQTYAPDGYKSASNNIYLDSPNDYGSNYIVFVCTKK